jgi:hypothetical protein
VRKQSFRFNPWLCGPEKQGLFVQVHQDRTFAAIARGQRANKGRLLSGMTATIAFERTQIEKRFSNLS